MKKILLTLVLIVAAITVTHAQVWIGGSVNAQLNTFNLTEHWSAKFSYGFLGHQREMNNDKVIERSFVLDFKTATAEFGIYYNF